MSDIAYVAPDIRSFLISVARTTAAPDSGQILIGRAPVGTQNGGGSCGQGNGGTAAASPLSLSAQGNNLSGSSASLKGTSDMCTGTQTTEWWKLALAAVVGYLVAKK